MKMRNGILLLLCLVLVLGLFLVPAHADTGYVTVTFDANGGYFGSNEKWTVGDTDAVKGTFNTVNSS